MGTSSSQQVSSYNHKNVARTDGQKNSLSKRMLIEKKIVESVPYPSSVRIRAVIAIHIYIYIYPAHSTRTQLLCDLQRFMRTAIGPNSNETGTNNKLSILAFIPTFEYAVSCVQSLGLKKFDIRYYVTIAVMLVPISSVSMLRKYQPLSWRLGTLQLKAKQT